MSPNPYESLHVLGMDGARPAVRRGLFRVVLPLVAVVPGAWAGMEYYLPPPGEGCGLSYIPALYFGAPAGGVLFAAAGRFLGRLLDRALFG